MQLPYCYDITVHYGVPYDLFNENNGWSFHIGAVILSATKNFMYIVVRTGVACRVLKCFVKHFVIFKKYLPVVEIRLIGYVLFGFEVT